VKLSGLRRAAEADLVLWQSDPERKKNLQREGTAPTRLVRNKIDLESASSGAWIRFQNPPFDWSGLPSG
jgi:hypothetical protein